MLRRERGVMYIVLRAEVSEKEHVEYILGTVI